MPYLSSRGCPAGYGLWPPAVLVTAATERVVDDVHADTLDAGPLLCGGFDMEVLLSCLGERFFAPSAAGNDTDGCHADTAEPLVLAARHPDADSAVVGLADDEGLDAACADELAAVVGPGFDVADVCTDRDLLERQECFRSSRRLPIPR